MKNFLLIMQIVIGALLIFVILLQNKGTGFGRAWSATPKSFTKRGIERLVFRLTFILVAVLIFTSILQFLV